MQFFVINAHRSAHDDKEIEIPRLRRRFTVEVTRAGDAGPGLRENRFQRAKPLEGDVLKNMNARRHSPLPVIACAFDRIVI